MSAFLRTTFFIFIIFFASGADSVESQVGSPEAAAFGEITKRYAKNNRVFVAESPNWDKPTVHTDNWPEFDQQVRNMNLDGIFWFAFDVYLEGTGIPRQDWVYHVHLLAAYEVYWDGVLIGRNGRPASVKSDESPGEVWSSFLIPNDLMTPGKHELKIKASAHYRDKGMKLLREGWIAPYNPKFNYVSFWSLIPSLLVGIAGVIGFYFLTLWFTEGRQPEHLIFFLLLESLTVLGYVIQWDHLVGYTYDLEWINLLMERTTALSSAVLLPLYFLIKNNAPRPWLWIVAAAILTLVLDELDHSLNTGWFVSFLLAFTASTWVGYRNKKWLWWESLGLAACLVAIASDDFENVFMFFPTLLSLILISHAIAMQQRKRALQDASLLETQLRAELLKKHIQPHFLLNTLTSLMEWVETDTQRSTEFIAELAEEFRLMSQVSTQPLISLSKEVLLCRKHLAIMSLRLQKQCEMEVSDIEASDLIPPAIFHTLIENAFSHNVYETETVVFHLEKHVRNKEVHFQFQAPLGQQQTSGFRKIGSGTGIKYIKARLGQTFGTEWALQESDSSEYWTTTLSVGLKRYQKVLAQTQHQIEGNLHR